jgi:hypothetical protein
MDPGQPDDDLLPTILGICEDFSTRRTGAREGALAGPATRLVLIRRSVPSDDRPRAGTIYPPSHATLVTDLSWLR